MSELTDATPAERHRLIAAHFTDLVDGVRDWDAPTPVSQWRASDVVDHLTGWLPGFLDAFAGVHLDEATESADFREKWRTQRDGVQALLDSPRATDVVETETFGTMTLERLLDQFYTADVFMHSWDLAMASGQEASLDPEFADRMYAGMAAMGPALHASGQFGAPQPVPADANEVDRLIALIGRDPRWVPASA